MFHVKHAPLAVDSAHSRRTRANAANATLRVGTGFMTALGPDGATRRAALRRGRTVILACHRHGRPTDWDADVSRETSLHGRINRLVISCSVEEAAKFLGLTHSRGTTVDRVRRAWVVEHIGPRRE